MLDPPLCLIRRFTCKFSINDIYHDPKKRHEWTVFGLGSTDNQDADMYIEDILILLINKQQIHHRINSTATVFQSRSARKFIKSSHQPSRYAALYFSHLYLIHIFLLNSEIIMCIKDSQCRLIY